MKKIIKSIINIILMPLGLKIINKESIYFSRDNLPYGALLVNDLAILSREKNIKIVFDVGANVGNFTNFIITSFPNAIAYCFEPCKSTFDKLKLNTILKHKNVVLVNCAVGDCYKDISMMELKSSEMNAIEINPLLKSFFSPNDISKVNMFNTRMIMLDNYCKDNNIASIDLLKIDTEGYDMNVLKGTEKMLSTKSIRFICIEYYCVIRGNREGQGFLNEIAEYLEKFGYEYVVSYTEWIDPKRKYFGVRNALFALV